MNDGQALAANLVTGLLVILASRFGLPVSTTHVSVGAIGGIGLANGSVDRGVMGGVLVSWLLTLPIAAITGALIYSLLGFFPH
jgi:PiT family inorganic phosphate transporter